MDPRVRDCVMSYDFGNVILCLLMLHAILMNCRCCRCWCVFVFVDDAFVLEHKEVVRRNNRD